MKRFTGIQRCLTLMSLLVLIHCGVSAKDHGPSGLHRPLTNVDWTGAVSTEWNFAGNWSGGVVPGTNYNVSIPAGLTRYPVVSAGDPNVNSVTLESGSGTQPTLTISGSTFTVTGNFHIDAGTVTQTGGTIYVTSGGLTITGGLIQSGGSLLSNVTLNVKAYGSLTQSGGLIHMANSTGTSPTDNITVSSNAVLAQSAGQIDTKDITIQDNAIYTQTGTGLLKVFHNYKNSGSFTSTTGTVEWADDGTSQAWPSASATDQFYNFTIDAGITVVVDKAGTIKVAGNWTNNGTVNITKTSDIIEFNGSGTQMVGGSGSTTFYGVVTSGSGIKTMDNSVTVAGVLSTGATLDIAGHTLTLFGAISGAGTLTGSSSSNLVIAGDVGTINFTQTSAATRSLSNITFNSGSSAKLGSALDVYGTVSLTSANFDLNAQHLTLKSTAAGTARIANLTGSVLSGAANVTMERYIKDAGGATGGRRYRLLAPTVNSTGSIKANWMEGQMNTVIGTNVNTIPGYGTQITGAGGNANGFDVTQSNQASLYLTTNGSTLGYTAVGSTSGTLNAKTGYFLFIRGDRSMSMTLPGTTNMPTSSTTLRTTGTLVTGTQTSFTNGFVGGAGKLNLVTNPYPSPIDWALVQPACGNITQYYTLWDPEIGTRGAFVTVKTDGTKSNSASAATTKIPSGQAFFVEASGASTPTVSIQEAHKTSGDNVGVFRMQGEPAESFAIDLYAQMPDSSFKNADAVLAIYDNSFSASVDSDDANEINNWDENIAIAREGQHLAIESRPVIASVDTLPLFMNNMKQQNYRFEFTPTSFTNTALKAELIDNFTGTRSLLSVTVPVIVNFTITSDPASKAADRFKAVFSPLAPLAIDVLTIKAQQKVSQNGEAGIQIDWSAKTETGMDHYDVERSGDGMQFTVGSWQLAVGNSNVPVNYSWFDNKPQTGNNFYRIKAVNKSGQVKYTSVVKVSVAKDIAAVSVYPNPVIGSSIGLQLTNMDKGDYDVSLYNSMGQRVFSSKLQHSGGTGIHSLEMGNSLRPGIYQVLVSSNNGIKVTVQAVKR